MEIDDLLTKILGYAFILASLYDIIQMHYLGGVDVMFIVFGALAMIVFKKEGLREVVKTVTNKIK